jgi:hypothetical protein
MDLRENPLCLLSNAWYVVKRETLLSTSCKSQYIQNKNWQRKPIYCINQPIKGIDLAMTKKLADSCNKLIIFAN